MKDFIDYLYFGDHIEAKERLVERIEEIISEKLKTITNEVFADIGLDEGNIQKMGRTSLVRVRFRGGKIQRRVKKSAVSGFTIRGGKLIRMSPQERRHRQMAARRSKFKRKSKMRQALRKRQMTLRKRKAMGLR